jgi:hypothetical protein
LSLTLSREDGTGVILTGIKRIVLSLMVTSKYSASGKALTISLGKVFFASIIPYLLVVRIHYSCVFVSDSLGGGEKLFEERVPVDDEAFFQ